MPPRQSSLIAADRRVAETMTALIDGCQQMGGTGVDARSSPTKVEILDGQVYPQPVCQTARHAYTWSPTSTTVRDPRRPSDVVVELVRDRSAGGCDDTAGHLISRLRASGLVGAGGRCRIPRLSLPRYDASHPGTPRCGWG